MNNKGKPLVSVIVPSYNHSKYITECVESIVNQTYKNFELIVIDDGSKDNSLEILEQLSVKYEFKLIQQENKGISATLNRGIEEFASGDYISFCASDDYFPLDKIEKQLRAFERLDYKIIAGASYYVNEKSEIIGRSGAAGEYELNFESIFVERKGFTSGTAMFKKEIFDKVGLYDENFGIEDAYMWYKATFNGYKIYVTDEFYLYYRYHQKNISKKFEWIDEEGLKIMNLYSDHPKYKEALNNRNLHKTIEYSSLNRAYAYEYFKKSHFKFSIKYFKALLKLIFS